jgi:hypothetical protein
MAVRPRSCDLSDEQRRALEIAAGSPQHRGEIAGARFHGQAACQDRARRIRHREAGDREGGRPDAQHAAADDHGRRAPGARRMTRRITRFDCGLPHIHLSSVALRSV